ncbi:hypothetical protein FD951_12755 [Pseudomonas chlororaphis subsp. aurantiaca]|nr:hypothetical protein FD951_12755 [Pseudomonas chlororaphis subsp. aurantiaca]
MLAMDSRAPRSSSRYAQSLTSIASKLAPTVFVWSFVFSLPGDNAPGSCRTSGGRPCESCSGRESRAGRRCT